MSAEQKIDKLLEEKTRFDKELAKSSPERKERLYGLASVHQNQRLHSQGIFNPADMPLRKKMNYNVPKDKLLNQFKKNSEYMAGSLPTWTVNSKNKREVKALKKVAQKHGTYINQITEKPQSAEIIDFLGNPLPNSPGSWRDMIRGRIDDVVNNPQKYQPVRDKPGEAAFFAVGGKYRNELIKRNNKYFQTDFTPHFYKERRFGLGDFKVLPAKNVQWAFLNPKQGQADYSKTYARNFRDRTQDEPVLMTGTIPAEKTFELPTAETRNERIIPYDSLADLLKSGKIKEEPFPFEKIFSGEYKIKGGK